jgi:ATP-dependent helicase/DNAse subunit B
MPITLVTGPANAGKARSLLDAVRREARLATSRGTAMPLLVVPTAADVEAYRRELADRGPTFGLSVTLFAGLIERIVTCAATADRELARAPIEGLARERMLRTVALDGDRPVSGGRTLGRALATAVGELELAGVSPAELRRGGGESELGDLYERYLRRLQELRRLDPELRARRALDVLRREPALWRGGAVCLYGFDDLTALELDAIETLGRVVDASVTVSLAYESGRVAFAGRSWAFEELKPLASEHVTLRARSDHYGAGSRAALHALERGIFETSAPPELRLFELVGTGEDHSEAQRIDPGGAVRLLEGGSERAELELVAEEVRALIDANIDPSEIAIVHRDPASIAEQLGESLSMLDVPHAIARRVAFADTSLGRGLLGAIACGCDGEPGCEPASLRDLLSWLRAPGVLEHAQLADRLEERALRSGVTGARAARALWERDHWPLERIDRMSDAAQRGALALLERAQRELVLLFSGGRRGAAPVLGEREREQELALRTGVRALTGLRELARLDAMLLGGAAGLIETLASLALERRAATVAGSGVTLLDPLALRARRVRVLLLCGLQEGTFPTVAASEPALADRRLREAGIAPRRRWSGRAENVASERYLFYATVSRATEALFLSWHASGDDGEASPSSLFLADVRDLFDERLWLERRRRGAGAFAPRLRGEASLFEQQTPAVESRSRLSDERVLALLREREVWSASSLERWAACPMAWFVERLLSGDGLEPDPEPLQRGSLAHAVLNDVYEALRGHVGSARLTPARLTLALSLAEEALAAHADEIPLAASEERRSAARRRLQADIERFLRNAADQESPFEPASLELPFGFPEEPGGLPALELGDGLRLRGRIDRVDVSPDGEAVVYDYKSGRVESDRSGAKWLQRSRFQMALYMRTVSELTELRPVGGLYQPLSGDLRARGALRADVASALGSARTDGFEQDDLDDLVRDVSAAAATAAQEARDGAVQPRPATCAYRGGCMYPTICRCGG